MARRKIKYQQSEDLGSEDYGSHNMTTIYGDPKKEFLERIGNFALLGTGIIDRLRVDPNMRPYMNDMNRILTINPYELGLPNAFPTYDAGDNRFYKSASMPIGEKGSINYGYDYDVDRGNFGLSLNFNTPFDLFALRKLKD